MNPINKKQIFYVATIFLMLFITAAPAMAIDMVAANQLTVAWDPVTQNADGTDITAGQTVEYQVYAKKFAASGPMQPPPVLIGTTEDTQYLVNFPGEGVWVFGFAAKKYEMIPNPDGSGAEQKYYSGESETVWSEDPAVCANGVGFAGVYLKIPGPGGGMRQPAP